MQWEARALMGPSSAYAFAYYMFPNVQTPSGPQSSGSERGVASSSLGSWLLMPSGVTWQVGNPHKEPKASWSRLPDATCPSQ